MSHERQRELHLFVTDRVRLMGAGGFPKPYQDALNRARRGASSVVILWSMQAEHPAIAAPAQIVAGGVQVLPVAECG